MVHIQILLAALVAAVSSFFAIRSIDGYKVADLINSYLLHHVALARGQEFFRTDSQWCKILREHYTVIRDEFTAYYSTHPAMAQGDLDSAQAIIDIGPTRWEVIYLRVYNRDTDLLSLFPQTAALLAQVPDCSFAVFSILQPGKVIPVHRGVYKVLFLLCSVCILAVIFVCCYICVLGHLSAVTFVSSFHPPF